MPTISKEIKIALLGIVAILLFVFGYNYLKGTGVFSSTKIVKAEYDNVQGLTPASYVQLQGFNIGTVKDIQLSNEHQGKVLVTMSINKDIVVPEDSKASIVSLDLLGTKAVTLMKGMSSKPIQDNGMIQGEITLGTIESLGASAAPAIDNAKNAIADLNVTIKSINNILDINSQNNLKSALADMSKTMKDFSQFANELNAQRAKISSLVASLNSFANTLDKNGPVLTKVLDNAEATTANLKKLDLGGTILELKKTMNDLQTTLGKVNNGSGSMALLMNDDKLYRNLKNTLATANNLLADINARPSRYINVAIFGKKNKNDCPPQPAPNSKD
ncbi:MAG TPA: MlaD family protein [Chitinophagaceae bacterium]|jgi:phospholipid/cholesterol/gamma-HCH transport system substrate-binding protein|nr:MlaD family protein [Chitinophagaceae bacterium]